MGFIELMFCHKHYIITYFPLLDRKSNMLYFYRQETVWLCCIKWKHYNDIIMSTMASQISSLTIVYSTIYSRCRSKKTSILYVTGLCEGNSPVTSEFSTQRASNVENVFIWWVISMKSAFSLTAVAGFSSFRWYKDSFLPWKCIWK